MLELIRSFALPGSPRRRTWGTCSDWAVTRSIFIASNSNDGIGILMINGSVVARIAYVRESALGMEVLIQSASIYVFRDKVSALICRDLRLAILTRRTSI